MLHGGPVTCKHVIGTSWHLLINDTYEVENVTPGPWKSKLGSRRSSPAAEGWESQSDISSELESGMDSDADDRAASKAIDEAATSGSL